jgi:hypothetical protein
MNLLKVLVLSAIAVPAICAAADTPRELCSDIKWNQEFLKDYPKAPAACRAVVVKDGLKYAQFDGHVKKVGKNVVEVEIHNVANTPISEIGFEVGTGGTINMNGKVVKVKDLQKGDLLTFWVPEGVYGISPTMAERPLKVVKPTAMY